MSVALKPSGATTIRSNERFSTGGTLDLKRRSGSPKTNTASSAANARKGITTHSQVLPHRLGRERSGLGFGFASTREEICSVIVYCLEHAHPAEFGQFALMSMEHVMARIL